MPERSRRPRDLNQLAASIVNEATAENREPVDGEKNPAAVALGRLGGLKGGKARASSMSPEERSRIARRAALARWERRR